MKHKRIKFCAVILLGLGLQYLNAQNALFVKNINGTNTQFSLANIDKLTFSSGNLIVLQKLGSSSSYSFANISRLNFGVLTGFKDVSIDESTKVKTYPNPVINELNVQFKSITAEIIDLQIIDLQGKILINTILKSEIGVNNYTIFLSDLKRGLYFCRIQIGNKFENSKFIKF